MTKCRVSLLVVLSISFFASAANKSWGQWADKTSVRFPQPDPLDYSNQLTIGDLDGDGDLDIVWANGGGFSSAGAAQVARIFINDGAGFFTDESAARGAASGNFRGAELGDIDGDGDLDLILAEDFNRLPNLLVNNGSGFFTDQSAARLPPLNLSATRAQFGDIDNDGDLDIYITNGGTVNRFGSGQNRIYINNGLGFFTDETSTRHPVAVLSEPQDAIFGDIDGDYDLDVRAGNRASNQSRLYRNNGAGVFTTVTGVPADANTYSYDFGDLDGDGDLDLLGANSNGSGNNSELLLRNDGTGAYTNISSNLSPNPSEDDNDSKFFDYDNDGDMDIIIARLGGAGEKIYNNNGVGMFTLTSGLLPTTSDSSLDVKVGDLTGDGRLDIVTAQGESGSFVNRFYIGVGNAIDTRAPRIINTEQQANTNNATGPYIIRASILDDMSSDRNFFDKGIYLNYAANGGPVQQVVMHYSGGQIYRGAIPGLACGGTVIYTYYVTATDFANNTATGPTKTFTVTSSSTPGDLDADSDVDQVDGDILAAVLVGNDTNPAHVCRGDINGDSSLDGLDVQAFVDLIP